MNRYEPTTHRFAFGIAALAMAALTISLTIVAPATVQSRNAEGGAWAATAMVTTAATEVAIVPSRIDVVGECYPKPSAVQVKTSERDSS